MTKAPPKLTKIQSKALEFIRSTIERSATAPTLRELCSFMGYSAIGSAQDLVSALRRKGYLHTPDKQSARSLVLTPKAIALHQPAHQSTEDTYIIHCLGMVPKGDPLQSVEERTGTIRMSVSMFPRPYPDPQSMFGLRARDDSMIDAGIFPGDWLIIQSQRDAKPQDIVLARVKGEATVKRLMKDRDGWYLKSENFTHSSLRPDAGEDIDVIGKLLAVQRILL